MFLWRGTQDLANPARIIFVSHWMEVVATPLDYRPISPPPLSKLVRYVLSLSLLVHQAGQSDASNRGQGRNVTVIGVRDVTKLFDAIVGDLGSP